MVYAGGLHRPPGLNLAKSYTQQISSNWDTSYPNPSTVSLQDLVAIVSVQAELNQTNNNSGGSKKCEVLQSGAGQERRYRSLPDVRNYIATLADQSELALFGNRL